ncbi:MAG: hypothetical protein GMKNLPBB_02815 [Myxococcota bacterium]|nr:hypothetical protein [Myxococcota bacterium]
MSQAIALRDVPRPFPPCRACGGPGPFIFLTREDGYQILDCPACGFITTFPVPDDQQLAEYYNQSYFRGGDEEAKAWGRSKSQAFEQALDLLEEFGLEPGDRILDAGCGHGGFLTQGAARGFRMTGVDVSAACIARCKTIPGVRAIQGIIEDIGESSEYEAVCFLDSFEHLPDFRDALDAAHRLLVEGGCLLIRVPNMNFHLLKLRALQLSGARWKYGLFTPPSHLNHFRPRVLKRLVESAGFRFWNWYSGAPAGYGGLIRRAPLAAVSRLPLPAGRWGREWGPAGNSLVLLAARF